MKNPDMEITTDIPAVRIRAPEIFNDPDFVKWLNDGAGKGVASFHVAAPGDAAGEWSDVFLLVSANDTAAGSNTPDWVITEAAMPAHLRKRVIGYLMKDPSFLKRAARHRFQTIVVWLDPGWV